MTVAGSDLGWKSRLRARNSRRDDCWKRTERWSSSCGLWQTQTWRNLGRQRTSRTGRTWTVALLLYVLAGLAGVDDQLARVAIGDNHQVSCLQVMLGCSSRLYLPVGLVVCAADWLVDLRADSVALASVASIALVDAALTLVARSARAGIVENDSSVGAVFDDSLSEGLHFGLQVGVAASRLEGEQESCEQQQQSRLLEHG